MILQWSQIDPNQRQKLKENILNSIDEVKNFDNQVQIVVKLSQKNINQSTAEKEKPAKNISKDDGIKSSRSNRENKNKNKKKSPQIPDKNKTHLDNSAKQREDPSFLEQSINRLSSSKKNYIQRWKINSRQGTPELVRKIDMLNQSEHRPLSPLTSRSHKSALTPRVKRLQYQQFIENQLVQSQNPSLNISKTPSNKLHEISNTQNAPPHSQNVSKYVPKEVDYSEIFNKQSRIGQTQWNKLEFRKTDLKHFPKRQYNDIVMGILDTDNDIHEQSIAKQKKIMKIFNDIDRSMDTSFQEKYEEELQNQKQHSRASNNYQQQKEVTASPSNQKKHVYIKNSSSGDLLQFYANLTTEVHKDNTRRLVNYFRTPKILK